MYTNIAFKHYITLNSREDVSLVTRIFQNRHRGNVNFSVNSMGKESTDVYMTSISSGASLEHVANFFRDVFSEVEIPETISFGFVNHNPSQEQSGIAIFKPKIKGYYVVTAQQLIEQHLNQDAFAKDFIELN